MSSPTPDPSALIYSLAAECHAAGSSADVARVCRAHPHLIPQVEAVLQVGRQVSAVGRAAAATAPEIPPTHVGRFALGGVIGKGGMGVVYRARDAELDRDVAVKLLRPDHPADDGTTRRFVEEAKITGKLQHPGIPAVHELGRLPDGRPYLAMKLIRGHTLAELWASRDRVGAGATNWLGVFESLCHAVGYAHSQGVIHRDLKPTNVMVGAFGEVQVMDWGLAKQVRSAECGARSEDQEQTVEPPSTPRSALRAPHSSDDTPPIAAAESERDTGHSPGTRTGTVLGTPSYMAPEQARGEVEHLDRRSDVFALGAILCELLTGRPPLTGGMPQVVADAAAGRFAAAYSRLDSCGEDPALVALCKRCLSVDRDARPADATAVAEAVARFRSESEARAKRAEVAAAEQRARRRVQTRATVIAGGILLTGVVGTSLGMWQAREAEKREASRADGEERAKEREAGERIKAENAAAAEKLAKEDALAQKQRAADADAQSRAALRGSTDDAVELLIGSKPTFGPREREYLEKTLKRWQQFADLKGDDEPSRATRAEGHFRVGRLWLKLGRHEEAIREIEVAIRECETLAADFPTNPEHPGNAVGGLMNYGLLLSTTGQADRAEQAYRRAVEIGEGMVRDFPTVPELRRQLAAASVNLGNAFEKSRQSDESVRHLRRSIALLRPLTEGKTARPEYLSALGSAYANLGRVLNARGRPKEAEPEIRAALAVQEKLAADFPNTPEHADSLAVTYANLGGVLKAVGKPTEAVKAVRAGLTVREKLAADFPTFPEFSAGLMKSQYALAKLLAEQGQWAAAEDEFRKTIATGVKLTADNPDVPEYRNELAQCHITLGIALTDQNRLEAAEKEYRTGFDIGEKLAAEFPAVPDYRTTLAAARTTLGNLHTGRANWRAGEEHHRAAVALGEQLAADFPTVPSHRYELAKAYSNLGNLFTMRRRWADAIEMQEKAKDVFARLAADHPEVYEYGVSLGGCYGNLGRLVAERGDAAKAVSWYSQSIDALAPLLRANPRDATTRMFLRNGHWGRAVATDAIGGSADSLADWDKAFELSPPAQQPLVRGPRATARLRAGKVAEAASDVDALRKLPGWSDAQWYDFARVYTAASAGTPDKSGEYAGAAVEMLRKAVKAGYKDTARLRQECDLDPLRDRDDFQKLVADLEAKYPPKREVLPPPRRE